jgi:hypothetical protein
MESTRIERGEYGGPKGGEGDGRQDKSTRLACSTTIAADSTYGEFTAVRPIRFRVAAGANGRPLIP